MQDEGSELDLSVAKKLLSKALKERKPIYKQIAIQPGASNIWRCLECSTIASTGNVGVCQDFVFFHLDDDL